MSFRSVYGFINVSASVVSRFLTFVASQPTPQVRKSFPVVGTHRITTPRAKKLTLDDHVRLRSSNTYNMGDAKVKFINKVRVMVIMI